MLKYLATRQNGMTSYGSGTQHQRRPYRTMVNPLNRHEVIGSNTMSITLLSYPVPLSPAQEHASQQQFWMEYMQGVSDKSAGVGISYDEGRCIVFRSWFRNRNTRGVRRRRILHAVDGRFATNPCRCAADSFQKGAKGKLQQQCGYQTIL